MQDLKEIARLLGAAGGKASAARMTPEQRKARAVRAATMRWERWKALKTKLPI